MMTTTPTPEPDTALPSLADEGDRPSITEVNGTVARFEMAYQPEVGERWAFGPTLLSRIPSIMWFGFSLVVSGIVVLAHHSSSNSALYAWVVERDRNGISASVLAFIVLASGIATLARTWMRGVIVQRSGIEARFILPLGVPRVRRWAWAQIHRMVLDQKSGVILELWNGQYEKLPTIAKTAELAAVLERQGAEHGIIVTRLG